MSNPNNTYKEWSEYSVERFLIKFNGEQKYEECAAVGKYEEELEVKTVKKQYKGIDAKQRTRGTGAGTLTPTMHISYEVYKKMHGMEQEDLATGVSAYGQKSMHEEFSITMLVEDEDGYEKLKSYPRCIVTSAPKKSVENGAETVATEDLTIALMPDKQGNCVYECLADEVDEEIKTGWLENWNYELVKVKEL